MDQLGITLPDHACEEIVVDSEVGDANYWRDVWRRRELLYFLVWRDILLRYKQTIFGIAWAVLRPLSTTLVMVIVFGKLARLSANGVPYTLMVLTGLLGWQFFVTAIMGGSGAMVANAGLVQKVYFPRLIIPASTILSCFVDYLISFAMLLAFMVYFQFMPSWRIVFLPGLTFLVLLSATGASLWFGALNVRYRDFNSIVPMLLQIGTYISPVGFATHIIPEKYRLFYFLNPMAGILDGYRWAILGQESSIYWPGFALSMVLVVGVFLSGIWYFRRMERTFADVI